MTPEEAQEVLGRDLVIQTVCTRYPDGATSKFYFVGVIRGQGMREWGRGASLHAAVQHAKTNATR